ncbi:hypothetical protein [Azospirillum sp. sgz302134]
MNEHKFPTIKDAADVLAELVLRGLGDLPMQLVVVPDSTIQALARAGGDSGERPAIMVEFGGAEGRLPVGLICPERMRGGAGSMPSRRPN